MVCDVVCMIGIPNLVSLLSSVMSIIGYRVWSESDGDSVVCFLWFI